jgi:hypothetical protein
MNSDYRDEQKKTRAASAPRPLKEYSTNSDANRATRRKYRIGKGRLLIGDNVQTIINATEE